MVEGTLEHIKTIIGIGMANDGKAAPCYKCGETSHETSECRHKGQLQCRDCGFKGHNRDDVLINRNLAMVPFQSSLYQ